MAKIVTDLDVAGKGISSGGLNVPMKDGVITIDKSIVRFLQLSNT